MHSVAIVPRDTSAKFIVQLEREIIPGATEGYGIPKVIEISTKLLQKKGCTVMAYDSTYNFAK